MSEVPWAKIWWDWYASRSHVDLSGVALALGAPLMLICRQSADRHGDGHGDGHSDVTRSVTGSVTSGVVWALHQSGKPVTAESLAVVVRFPVDAVRAALQELVDAETLVVSDDGVYGFANFWRYQESRSAARTRRYRAREKRHSDAPRDASGDARVTRKVTDRDQRSEINPLTPKGGKEPARLKQPLEDAVRAEFFRRNCTSQKAAPSQWLDGCKTVQEALDLGTYPDALTAVEAFARALVDACAKGEKLGLALRQVTLGQPANARPLSNRAEEMIAKRRSGEIDPNV